MRPVLLVLERLAAIGGAETHVIALADALAEAGHAVHLAAGEIDPTLDLGRVVVHRTPGLESVSTGAEGWERLRRVVEEVGPRVVHLHHLASTTGPRVRDLRRLAPVVLSAHTYVACTSGRLSFAPGHDCPRRHGPGCLPNVLLRRCTPARNTPRVAANYRPTSRVLEGYRAADAVVAHSAAMLGHLERNGVERRHPVPLFPPSVGEGTEPARPLEPDRVLFSGRVVPEKGIEVLLRAAVHADVRIRVVGDGWGRGSAEALARRLGIGARTDFVGWLDGTELEDEYRRAGIVVVPSLWPEPFGLVGVEAMLAGRPVVASRTGGIPDWLEDGVTGRLVDPGDPRALGAALGGLAADPELAWRMGQRGHASARRTFSRARHVEAMLLAYAAAADRHGGA